MKIKKLLALLLCFSAAATMLAGCGGGEETPEDGRGDIIVEEPESPGDSDDVSEEPEINFEDFFGCWEYENYDVWLYVYGDGTYEIFRDDGDSTAGEYEFTDMDLLLDSGEIFSLDGAGGLIDGEGDSLFPSELPEFPEAAYFEEYDIEINYTMGQGDMLLTDGAYYYEGGTEGDHYGRADLVCNICLEESYTTDGYTVTTIALSRGFREEDIPMFAAGVSMDSWYRVYDYYTGTCLPDTDMFDTTGDNDYYYEIETENGIADIQISDSFYSTTEIDGYTLVFSNTLTIVTPEWYDGLVLSVVEMPESYEDVLDEYSLYKGLEEPVEAGELPWDLYESINCRIL